MFFSAHSRVSIASPLGIAGSGPEGLLCPQHALQERPRCSETGKKKTPTQQQQKNTAVFKPPLRFPAPGASPLRKIKQPGVCFLSPPAALRPGGCPGRRAQPDTAAPRPRALSLARGDGAQGGGCRGTSPFGTPCSRGLPRGRPRWAFPTVCFA